MAERIGSEEDNSKLGMDGTFEKRDSKRKEIRVEKKRDDMG